MNSHEIKPQKCPYCGHAADRVSETSDDSRAPQPNDVCVCLNCAAFQRVGENLELQKVTPEFLAELKECEDTWKELNKARHAVKMLRFGRVYGGIPWAKK